MRHTVHPYTSIPGGMDVRCVGTLIRQHQNIVYACLRTPPPWVVCDQFGYPVSQVVAVNDSFARITGHPPNFPGLHIFWGESTDKARPPRPPELIAWTPYILSIILSFASHCPGHADHQISRYHRVVLPGGTPVLSRASLNSLIRAFVCVQAEVKLLELSLSRSYEAAIK